MNVCFTTGDSPPLYLDSPLPLVGSFLEGCGDLCFLFYRCLYLAAVLHPQEQEDGNVILLLD